MNYVGYRFDNAICESVFAMLECELLDPKTIRAQAEARLAVCSFIEVLYSPVGPRSAIGKISPRRI